MMKPILYPERNNPNGNTLLLNRLDAINFPYTIDLQKSQDIIRIEYNGLRISGIDNIIYAMQIYENTHDLSEVFKMKTKSKKIDINKKGRILDLLAGFILGGMWITIISSALGNSIILLSIATLVIPLLILGFPYYWPRIKQELQRKN